MSCYTYYIVSISIAMIVNNVIFDTLATWAIIYWHDFVLKKYISVSS